MAPKPTSQTLTLRLKHHKTTIFLHVERTQTFSSIASDLLETLTQRNPDGQFAGRPVPSDPAAVKFGRCIDDSDPDAGWEEIPTGASNDDGEEKQARRKSGDRRKSVLEADCPNAIGLKDASMLAFRFVDLDPDARNGEGDVTDGLDEKRGQWDVVLPGFDDDEPGPDPSMDMPDVDLPTL